MKFYKICSLIFLLNSLSNYTSFAQFYPGDSNYLNNFFKENLYISYWNNPGTWYHNSEVSSLQNFYEKTDSNFLFYNDEFADCYNKIITSNVLERDTAINTTIHNFDINHNSNLFGSAEPFVKLKFTLNNKTAYSYAMLDSCKAPIYNNDYAFVIISGTGTNLIKQIYDGNGYHDMNCFVRNLLEPQGDIYILCLCQMKIIELYFGIKKSRQVCQHIKYHILFHISMQPINL